MVKSGGEVTLKTNAFEVKVKGGERLPEGDILIGVRPEHLAITELREAGEITFKGKVILSEVIGSETIVHVDAGLGDLLRILIPEIYRKPVGAEIEAGFSPEALYLFSPRDERLLARGGDIIG